MFYDCIGFRVEVSGASDVGVFCDLSGRVRAYGSNSCHYKEKEVDY